MTWELSPVDKIIKPVKWLEVPKHELVIVGGAALELFGIKKTRDIDVVVTQARLLELSRRHTYDDPRYLEWIGDKLVDEEAYVLRPAKDDYSVGTYGKLAIMAAPNDRKYQATFEDLRDEAVEIEGVLVSPPQRILEWKQAVNRRKDQDDIQKIQDFLAQNTQPV